MFNSWKSYEPRPVVSRLAMWTILAFLVGVPVALELIGLANGG